MADQLNMAGMNLNGGNQSYIPPHMRGKPGGPPPPGPMPNGNAPPMNGGLNGSAWANGNGNGYA